MLTRLVTLHAINTLLEMLECSLLLIHTLLYVLKYLLEVLKYLLEVLKSRSEASMILIYVLLHRVEMSVMY